MIVMLNLALAIAVAHPSKVPDDGNHQDADSDTIATLPRSRVSPFHLDFVGGGAGTRWI